VRARDEGSRRRGAASDRSQFASETAGYFPREVFFFGLGLPAAAAFSVAACFAFFDGIISLLPPEHPR
jgi:hypothetical protein